MYNYRHMELFAVQVLLRVRGLRRLRELREHGASGGLRGHGGGCCAKGAYVNRRFVAWVGVVARSSRRWTSARGAILPWALGQNGLSQNGRSVASHSLELSSRLHTSTHLQIYISTHACTPTRTYRTTWGLTTPHCVNPMQHHMAACNLSQVRPNATAFSHPTRGYETRRGDRVREKASDIHGVWPQHPKQTPSTNVWHAATSMPSHKH